MKIYVMNVTTSVDRKNFQQEQANRLGLSLTFFPAITPNDFSEQEYQDLYETWERPMLKGEIGCFLSHKNLWQKIADDNKPAVILEDDAILSKSSAVLFQALEDFPGIDRLNLEARNKKKVVAKNATSINNHCIRKLYLDRSGGAGYILWPSGAKKLLSLFANKAGIADKVLADRRLSSYQLEPAVVVPADYCQVFDIDTSLATASTINPGNKDQAKSSSILSATICKVRRIIGQLLIAYQRATGFLDGERRLIVIDKSHF